MLKTKWFQTIGRINMFYANMENVRHMHSTYDKIFVYKYDIRKVDINYISYIRKKHLQERNR